MVLNVAGSRRERGVVVIGQKQEKTVPMGRVVPKERTTFPNHSETVLDFPCLRPLKKIVA